MGKKSRLSVTYSNTQDQHLDRSKVKKSSITNNNTLPFKKSEIQHTTQQSSLTPKPVGIYSSFDAPDYLPHPPVSLLEDDDIDDDLMEPG